MSLKKDKEIFDNEIVPAMQALKTACKKQGMPMFATVCYHHGEEGSKVTPQYGTDFISDYDLGIQLPPDNYIANCIKVTNGFKVVAQEREVVNMSDFVVDEEDDKL